jgi:hypothetical protein
MYTITKLKGCKRIQKKYQEQRNTTLDYASIPCIQLSTGCMCRLSDLKHVKYEP